MYQLIVIGMIVIGTTPALADDVLDFLPAIIAGSTKSEVECNKDTLAGRWDFEQHGNSLPFKLNIDNTGHMEPGTPAGFYPEFIWSASKSNYTMVVTYPGMGDSSYIGEITPSWCQIIGVDENDDNFVMNRKTNL